MSLFNWPWSKPERRARSAADDLVDSRNPQQKIYRTDVFHWSPNKGNPSCALTISSMEPLTEDQILALRTGSFDIPGSGRFNRVVGVNMKVYMVFPNMTDD